MIELAVCNLLYKKSRADATTRRRRQMRGRLPPTDFEAHKLSQHFFLRLTFFRVSRPTSRSSSVASRGAVHAGRVRALVLGLSY